MRETVCEHCGVRRAVAPVTYSEGSQRVTQLLCDHCKQTLLGRRRTRSRAHRHRRRRRTRLVQAVREGGPLAYLGAVIFVLGLVLLPTLVAISLLTR